MLILVLGSILIPKETLEKWGIYLFFLSALLMAVGLVPYRRLQKLESNPNKIIINDSYLLYIREEKTLSIPIEQIQSLEWVERTSIYGINLRLKNGQTKFLAFFSKRSFDELKEILS